MSDFDFDHDNNEYDIFSEPVRNYKKSSPPRRTWIYMALIAAFLGIAAWFYFAGPGNDIFGLGIFEGRNAYRSEGAQEDTQSDGRPAIVINDTPAVSDAAMPAPAAQAGALSIKDIVKKNKPAVVGVVSKVYRGSAVVGESTGSGIIMTSDGYIITNDHVVEDTYDPSVVLYDGREYTAKIIGRDSKSDLAVLRIDETGLSVAEFGDSDVLEEGDIAVAIGNPIGLELYGTVTAGIISAVNRDLTINDRIMTLVQTDASINPGNSGGPLINQYGQVIGINSIKIGLSNVEGLGFAIPINVAKPIIDDLISDGYVKNRPVIGISGQNITKAAADVREMPQGVYVDYISPSGYALESGLSIGDVIISINGKTITNMTELNYEKEKFRAGDTVKLGVWRGGRTIEIDVKLALEKTGR